MSFILETIKYRADFMKTFGYALCSPIVSYFFEIIRHHDAINKKFDVFVFVIYFSLMLLGVAAIIMGMLLLDLHVEKQNGELNCDFK